MSHFQIFTLYSCRQSLPSLPTPQSQQSQQSPAFKHSFYHEEICFVVQNSLFSGAGVFEGDVSEREYVNDGEIPQERHHLQGEYDVRKCLLNQP